MSFWNFKQKKISIEEIIIDIFSNINSFIGETDFDRIFASEDFESIRSDTKSHYEKYLSNIAYKNYLMVIIAGSLFYQKNKALSKIADDKSIFSKTFFLTLEFHEEYILTDKIFLGDFLTLNKNVKDKTFFFAEVYSKFADYTKDISDMLQSKSIFWEEHSDIIEDDFYEDLTPSYRKIYYNIVTDLLLSQVDEKGHLRKMEFHQIYDSSHDYALDRGNEFFLLIQNIFTNIKL